MNKIGPARITTALIVIILGAVVLRVQAETPPLIDLRTADPAEVDLATVDPTQLLLNKQIVKTLDLKKWDLSLIDVSKVEDKLAAKWIIKRLKEAKADKNTLSQYAPGELERIQQDNLKWIRQPEPFENSQYRRDFKISHTETARAADSIDQVLREKLGESGQDFNPRTTDEQFVRRIYLDAAGRIPTAQEAQAFLADGSSDKRRELIDTLLLSQDYPSQMFNWAADMMRVKELKGNQGDNAGYQAWLIDQFEANRPWDKTVYDLLTAEGDLVTQPAVGWLVRDAGMPTASVSNTLTTFMGANISCAECHNHPFTDFTQRNFYELAAFFGSTAIPGKNVRGASPIIKNRYHSVTAAPDSFTTYPEDYKYDDAEPGSKVTPAFPILAEMAPRVAGTGSRPLDREDFARWMTNKKNDQFAATVANRLWGKAFGRAAMEPVTEMDNLDLADNPRLIKAIAELMQDLDFDLMEFQRVLYNTRAYQAQASVTPDDGEVYQFPGPVLRRMTAEQAWDSFVTLMEGPEVNQYHRQRELENWSQNVLKDGVVEAMEQSRSKKFEFAPVISKANNLSKKLFSQYASKKNSDARSVTPRASELKQPEEPKHFLRQFGQSERELADTGNLEGGIPQVLMLMNGDTHKMLGQSDSFYVQLVTNASQDQRLDLMYLSFFSRCPTEAEKTLIAQEEIDLNELTWILINSREFMFVQ